MHFIVLNTQILKSEIVLITQPQALAVIKYSKFSKSS